MAEAITIEWLKQEGLIPDAETQKEMFGDKWKGYKIPDQATAKEATAQLKNPKTLAMAQQLGQITTNAVQKSKSSKVPIDKGTQEKLAGMAGGQEVKQEEEK